MRRAERIGRLLAEARAQSFVDEFEAFTDMFRNPDGDYEVDERILDLFGAVDDALSSYDSGESPDDLESAYDAMEALIKELRSPMYKEHAKALKALAAQVKAKL